MGEDDEYAATGNLVRIIGVTQGVDTLDLGFQLPEPLVHLVGQFVGAVILLGQGVVFSQRDGIGRLVFFRLRHRMRIGAAKAVAVRIVDMDRGPLPTFLGLHALRDPRQLLDDRPVQQTGILIEAAAIRRYTLEYSVNLRRGGSLKRIACDVYKRLSIPIIRRRQTCPFRPTGQT
ncbi:hypothetical protein C8J38_1011006 [Rhizobium sp. PP-WC-2G-219]|nr:hypothetical protein C8J38_1011006 [Rhizobium sp. PP-WC-2G-219]